jgi:PAS domain S-box-containing protein
MGERAISVGLVFLGFCAAQGVSMLLRCPPFNVSPLWLPLGYVAGVFVATEKRNWGWWWGTIGCACILVMVLLGFPVGASVWAGVFLPLAAAAVALSVEMQPGNPREVNLRRLIVMVVGGSLVFWVLCIVPGGMLGWLMGFDLDYGAFFKRQALNLPLNMALVAPMVMVAIERVRARRGPVRWREGTLVGLALFSSARLAFWVNDGRRELDCLVFLPLPVLLWLAIRFEVGCTAAGMLLVAAVAFFTAAHREGPFAHLAPEPRVLAVQLFVLALGVPVVFLSSVVAERERARERSEKSNRLFRAFVENAPVPVIVNPSPDDGRLYVNPAFTRVLGYTRADIPTPEAYFLAAYPDEAYREARRTQWGGIVERALETGGYQDLGEAEVQAKDGTRLHVQARVAIVQGHKLIFFSDLTARRKAEAELRLTQYAVDHNPAIIYRLDTSGRFAYANEAACRRLGYAQAELLTKYLWEVAATVSQESWGLRLASLREQGVISLETIFAR